MEFVFLFIESLEKNPYFNKYLLGALLGPPCPEYRHPSKLLQGKKSFTHPQPPPPSLT